MQGRSLLLVAAGLLGGCSALAWYRPNTSDAQFYQDLQECEQRALAMYPSQSQDPQSYRTSCATYGYQTNCTTKAAPTIGADVSISQRASASEMCLRSKGYQRGAPKK